MNKELNDKICGLRYDPKEILSIQGEDISSFVPNTGYHDQQKYIVVHRQKAGLTTENAELSALESIKNSVYPGAILLANRALMDNNPTVPSFLRAPMRFHIDLPGLGKDGAFTIDNPTQSALEAKIDEKFTEWCDKCSDKYRINAAIKYKDTMAYSESQLSAALNLNYKSASADLGIDFKAISEGKKSVMVCEYEQIFYTVKCDKPEFPAQFFADSVTWQDLQAKGIGNDAPPAYVHAVSYGRRVFVKLETKSTSSKVEAALRAAMQDDFDIEASAEYKSILKNTSMSVIVLGGGVHYASELIQAKELKEVKAILAKSATCGKDNPGRLFSYTCNFMKDDAVAVVKDTSEYIETTCTEYADGTITLQQNGGYVGQFCVTWEQRTYDDKGVEKVEPHSWEGNWQDRTSPFSVDIPLAGNCFDIHVVARECTGLAWEWWRKVIDVSKVPLIKQRTFHIGGTTLSPSKSISPAIGPS